MQKYWLAEEEYLNVWKPIQDKIFVQDKGLPELVYRAEFEMIALRGGCLFLEEDFKQLQKAMQEVGDKIDANDKAAVEADLASLKAVIERTANMEEMNDADIDALKSGKEKLMESAQKLFAKVYEQAQGAQGAGPDMGAGTGAGYTAPDDDIVDGDFREV